MSRLNKTSAGEIIYHCRESGKELAAFKTLRCQHCGMHWIVMPGSGRRRGWCMSCNGPTCGKAECDACVPTEQQLENIEAGRDLLFRPIRVGIHAAYPSEILLPDGSACGFNLGTAGDSERRDTVPGIRPEALDHAAAECTGVPVHDDTGLCELDSQPVDAGTVGG